MPITAALAERVLADCQVAVLVSTGHAVGKLKALLAPAARLVLWTQHAADQPAMQPLAESEVSALVDHFVFVSGWQQAGYEHAFALSPQRCRVIGNAVGPAFAGLFADGRTALAAKAWPPRLAYTSTPFRGLETLLDVFPAIRAAVPGVTLGVYSSMQVYHLPPARYGRLWPLVPPRGDDRRSGICRFAAAARVGPRAAVGERAGLSQLFWRDFVHRRHGSAGRRLPRGDERSGRAG